jgi:hypothetical protein
MEKVEVETYQPVLGLQCLGLQCLEFQRLHQLINS